MNDSEVSSDGRHVHGHSINRDTMSCAKWPARLTVYPVTSWASYCLDLLGGCVVFSLSSTVTALSGPGMDLPTRGSHLALDFSLFSLMLCARKMAARLLQCTSTVVVVTVGSADRAIILKYDDE